MWLLKVTDLGQASFPCPRPSTVFRRWLPEAPICGPHPTDLHSHCPRQHPWPFGLGWAWGSGAWEAARRS